MDQELNKNSINFENEKDQRNKHFGDQKNRFRNYKNRYNHIKFNEQILNTSKPEDLRFPELKNERPKFNNWRKDQTKNYNNFHKDNDQMSKEYKITEKNHIKYKCYNKFNEVNNKDLPRESNTYNYSRPRNNNKNWEFKGYNNVYKNNTSYNNYSNYHKKDYRCNNHKNHLSYDENNKGEHTYNYVKRSYNKFKDRITDLNSELETIENNKILASRNNSEPNLNPKIQETFNKENKSQNKKYLGKKNKKKRIITKPRSPNNTTQFLISVHTKKERDKLKKEKAKSKKKILKERANKLTDHNNDLPLNENNKNLNNNSHNSYGLLDFKNKTQKNYSRSNHHHQKMLKNEKIMYNRNNNECKNTNRQQERSLSGEVWNHLVPGGSMIDLLNSNFSYNTFNSLEKENDDDMNTINSFYS